IDGEAAFTCGSFAISSANSANNSLRVNHSLGGRDSEAQGNRYAIIVSDPRSRIPPSTESFSPLITELTAITVVIPMTMPRIVSDERSRFFRSVSSAKATSSLSFSECSIRTNARKREARESARVWAIVDMLCLSKNPIPRAKLPPDPTAKLSTPDTFRKRVRRSALPAILPAPTRVAPPRAAKLSGKQVSRQGYRTERQSLRQSRQLSQPQSRIAAGCRRAERPAPCAHRSLWCAP